MLPIKSNIKISEGWIYSKEEQKIHHNYFHHGVDFETTYGEPVYASADGFATASYHRFPVIDKTGFPRLHNGRPLLNGFGLMIQITTKLPNQEIRITQYGHLSRLENPMLLKRTPKRLFDLNLVMLKLNNGKRKYKKSNQEIDIKLIKYQRLLKKNTNLPYLFGFNHNGDLELMDSYYYNYDELKLMYLKKSPFVTKVNQGQRIGYVGTSAVFTGEAPYDEENFTNIKQTDNSWDEIHLHFEEATRDSKTRGKIDARDPFGIYKSKKWYTADNFTNTLFIDS